MKLPRPPPSVGVGGCDPADVGCGEDGAPVLPVESPGAPSGAVETGVSSVGTLLLTLAVGRALGGRVPGGARDRCGLVTGVGRRPVASGDLYRASLGAAA